MKVHKIMKWFSVGIIALMIAGCGSTESDSDTSESVVGGVAGAPAQMSLTSGNLIVKNAFYNYFKYTAREDEKLTLDAILEFAITSTKRIECQETGETYVVVYDAQMNELSGYKTCTSKMSIEFPSDGTYIFQIQYPGNEGYFLADSDQ